MYQTIIQQLSQGQITTKFIKKLYSELEDTGSIFIICKNAYSNEFIKWSFFDIIEVFVKNEFCYINTIVFPVTADKTNTLKHNVSYILWFVKDETKMFFNKDAIREKHIWKDVEWGKRVKNYHALGKDPGNVWIPTIDDGKGRITEHLMLTRDEIVSRLIKSTTDKGDKTLINFEHDNKEFDKTKSPGSLKVKSESDVFCDVLFDSSEKMHQIKDGFVDLMITSPPYWDLKNYFKSGQIGQESYQDYLSRLKKVWSETFRVLNNTGSMWININIRKKGKQVILIPQDIIKQCKEIGFLFKDVIIWHKSSGIPTHKNNIVDRHEYFLWFTKTEKFKFNTFQFNDYKNTYLENGLLWNINRKAGSVGKNFIHPAVYPDKLIERVIELCSDENDIVLDPFLGSGTTSICASNLNRNSIGYEFNEGFKDLIDFRFDKDISNQKVRINFHSANNALPRLKVFRNNL